MKGSQKNQQVSKHSESNHAFNKQPKFTQIIAYSIVISEIIIFSVCIQPHIPYQTTRILLLILFYVTLALLLVSWFITSYTDTRDAKIGRSSNFGQKELQKIYSLYCGYCRSLVSDNSRHCKLCNTCIQQFDHHCIWINNCIGKYNYTSFMWMLLSLLIHFISFIASMALVWQEMKWKQFMIQMIASWVSFAFVIISFIMVFFLTIFHFYLMYHGITTYQHFTSSKNKVFPESKKRIQQKNRDRQKSEVQLYQNNHRQNNIVRHSFNDLQNIASIKIQHQFEVNKDHSEKSSSIYKNENIEKNSQASSYAEGQLLGRNKSYDYIFGRLDLSTSIHKTKQGSDDHLKVQMVSNIPSDYKSANPQNKTIKRRINFKK